jgi:hypothetical protein
MAGLGASTESLVNDGFDGARASATFGAATEAAIDLLGIARKVFRSVDGTTDIVVAEDVAGTNNHKDGGPIGDAEPSDIYDRSGMQKEKPSFQVIPN